MKDNTSKISFNSVFKSCVKPILYFILIVPALFYGIYSIIENKVAISNAIVNTFVSFNNTISISYGNIEYLYIINFIFIAAVLFCFCFHTKYSEEMVKKQRRKSAFIFTCFASALILSQYSLYISETFIGKDNFTQGMYFLYKASMMPFYMFWVGLFFLLLMTFGKIINSSNY
tara:strand:+ start:80 stop:598 length:519 start_codon:yes stop_codon:yes gene_type:complete